VTEPMRNGPQFPVDAPQVQPPATGLVTLARHPEVDADGRWRLGYGYRPEAPAGLIRNRSSVTSTIGANIGGANGPDVRVEVIPVMLTVEDVNSTFGFKVTDEPGRARRLLEAYTSKLLAHELWTGEIALEDDLPNPILAAGAAVVNVTPAGGPVAPQKGVARLRQALSDGAMGDGMMHCSPYVGIQLPDAWRNENTLEQHGFVVVADAGYPGTGPNGEDGQWMYATEIVSVRLDEIVLVPEQLRESINTASNTITYRAERVGAADFAGPVYACQIEA